MYARGRKRIYCFATRLMARRSARTASERLAMKTFSLVLCKLHIAPLPRSHQHTYAPLPRFLQSSTPLSARKVEQDKEARGHWADRLGRRHQHQHRQQPVFTRRYPHTSYIRRGCQCRRQAAVAPQHVPDQQAEPSWGSDC